jgi:hypothetical protein
VKEEGKLYLLHPRQPRAVTSPGDEGGGDGLSERELDLDSAGDELEPLASLIVGLRRVGSHSRVERERVRVVKRDIKRQQRAGVESLHDGQPDERR